MIQPGPITASTARDLEDYLAMVESNQRRTVAIVLPMPGKFPAAITRRDANGRHTWYEQDIDATGQRYRSPGGRFGNPTQNPAYSFGDGSIIADADFPLPVMLSERVIHTSGSIKLGMAYEFPLYCACVGGGSGGGFALTACCPNPIPTTLTATISAPSYPFYDGLSFTLGYGFWGNGPPVVCPLSPGTGWGAAISGDPTVPDGCPVSLSVCLQCAFEALGTTQFSLGIADTVGALGGFPCPNTTAVCVPGFTFPGSGLGLAGAISCNPFLITFAGVFRSDPLYSGVCSHAGEAYVITITE